MVKPVSPTLSSLRRPGRSNRSPPRCRQQARVRRHAQSAAAVFGSETISAPVREPACCNSSTLAARGLSMWVTTTLAARGNKNVGHLLDGLVSHGGKDQGNFPIRERLGDRRAERPGSRRVMRDIKNRHYNVHYNYGAFPAPEPLGSAPASASRGCPARSASAVTLNPNCAKLFSRGDRQGDVAELMAADEWRIYHNLLT